MDIKPKHWYIFSITFIIVLFISVLAIEQHKNKIYELIERKSSLEGQIHRIKPSHGASYIELNSGRKVLIPQLNNYKYSPSGFCRLASVGDSVVKYFDNDTLYLFKNNDKYIFKIGAALNLPE
jgi:hypothetical protein